MNNMKILKKICGAKTRQGTPCKKTRLYKNGRCKNHGGLSTGPRTEEGKARALANLNSIRKDVSNGYWLISTPKKMRILFPE